MPVINIVAGVLIVALALFCKFWRPREFVWLETAAQIAVPVVFGVIILFATRGMQMVDTEIWNGQVTDTRQVRVSCEHSYECFCTESCSGSGSNQSCTRICQTCYDHSHDYDWRVYSDVGDFNISRIDRQGRREPPRWAAVRPGDPVARERSYINYVQASPDSLFNVQRAADHEWEVPDYPSVHDYQHVDRVLTIDTTLSDEQVWNDGLANMLRTLGPDKQANIILFVVQGIPAEYRYAVEEDEDWLGGNKNDVVIFLGVAEDGLTLSWVDVMTWALNYQNSALQLNLRRALQGVGELDAAQMLPLIENHVREDFNRPEMASFEYLRHNIQVPLWVQVVMLLVQLIVAGGLAVYFHSNEIRNWSPAPLRW